MATKGTATVTISELREFASFAPAEQRYIRRSLDVALGKPDTYKRWARDAGEMVSIREQYEIYRSIDVLRALHPEEAGLDGVEDFLGPLIRMAAFDLAQERLDSFSAFRFLYERLLGAWSRPWLPSAFCGAAALPLIRPERRRLLLHSISEAAAMAQGWSGREPKFYPEWIEKEVA
ncbi:hypothetical protein [Novosphingobium sp. 9]|uniref:hypothetical protein n=1 Tax=Novosphingobium sp. 9 TaxID=2025349 RepID=UPI0021B537C8|nr:hypothetical protein [Novosphingobium sp. 9]